MAHVVINVAAAMVLGPLQSNATVTVTGGSPCLNVPASISVYVKIPIPGSSFGATILPIKYQADSIRYFIDCTNLLDSTETISSAGIWSTDSALTIGTVGINTSPLVYSDGTVTATGQGLCVVVGAGTINVIEILRGQLSTSEGNTRSFDVNLQIIP